jgi:hypothetical protein
VAQPIASGNAPVAKFADIRNIYIDDLGKGEGTDGVREKIRLRLVKDGHFMVVEKPELADAVLTGTAGVNVVNNSIGTTSFEPHAVLRLVAAETEEAVWSFEYKPGFSASRGSAESRMADQVVDKLMKDAMPRAKKK